MTEFLSNLTFNINSLIGVAIASFTIGMIASALLFIHRTNGIRVTMAQTRHRTLRDCDERYD